jgi:hypothetical protein
MIIAIDFDGTLVEHRYPKIGEEVPHAVRVCRRLIVAGHQLILWTMRDGQKLIEAERWCEEHNITLWALNKNPQQEIWSQSPKAYAQLYIDDAAINCPLTYPLDARPYVDWEAVEALLTRHRFL